MSNSLQLEDVKVDDKGQKWMFLQDLKKLRNIGHEVARVGGERVCFESGLLEANCILWGMLMWLSG